MIEAYIGAREAMLRAWMDAVREMSPQRMCEEMRHVDAAMARALSAELDRRWREGKTAAP